MQGRIAATFPGSLFSLSGSSRSWRQFGALRSSPGPPPAEPRLRARPRQRPAPGRGPPPAEPRPLPSQWSPSQLSPGARPGPTTATARPPGLGLRVAMAGGRGGPGRGLDEPPESYPQRQEHELQALEAIYGADFQDLRPDACKSVGTWLVRAVLACCGPAFTP